MPGYIVHTASGELYHFGVKGMKWRRKKRQYKPGTERESLSSKKKGFLGGYFNTVNRATAKAQNYKAKTAYKKTHGKSSKVHGNTTSDNWYSPTAILRTRVHGGSRGKHKGLKNPTRRGSF